MLSKTLVLLASAASVIASPLACPAPKANNAPVLPTTGSGKDLTNPPADLKLLHIALGFGIQNYTCTQKGAKSSPTGALAVLYDARPLFPGQGPRSLSDAQFAALPGDVVNHLPLPLNMDKNGNAADPAHPGADLHNPFPDPAAPLKIDGINKPLDVIGHHFFTDKGVPNFVLDGGHIQLLSKKDEAVDAPASANKGPDATGAVAWLKLSAADGAVGPAKLVYRVITAGGNSHGCANSGEDSTPYAATYWFYG